MMAQVEVAAKYGDRVYITEVETFARVKSRSASDTGACSTNFRGSATATAKRAGSWPTNSRTRRE